MMKKKLCAWMLILCLIASLFPAAFALDPDATTVQVSDYAGLTGAVTAAESDIVLDLTQDVTIPSVYSLQSDYNVTITSSNGSKLILYRSIRLTSHLTLRNLTVEASGNGKIDVRENGAVDVENMVFTGGSATSADSFLNAYASGSTITIYSMTVGTDISTSDVNKGSVKITHGTVTVKPTGTVNIPTIIDVGNNTGALQIVPQEGYTVTAASFNGTNITSALNQGTYTVPYTGVAGEGIKYSQGLSISVTEGAPAGPAPVAGGDTTAGGIDYAWSYGGTITEEGGTFTITPYTAAGIEYVIDAVYVDGVSVEVTDPDQAMTVNDAASSVFASFAYTVNFQNPDNGTLSVIRGGFPLTSGDIVRGGDVLTITASGTAGAYALDELTLTGITDNGDGTYTVTAENGDATPSISATLAPVLKAATPTFSPAAGAVGENVTVQISCTTPGAVIYYTTDGEAPTAGSSLYSAAIPVSAGLTVKAIAVAEGYADSEVASASYTVRENLTISTAEELTSFAAAVNGGDGYQGVTVTLDRDIVLTADWDPIGTAASPFQGIFDGAGHTVSGLAIADKNSRYLGLFGYVSGGAVRNLTVSGEITATADFYLETDAYPYIGGVAGYARSAEFTGCVSAVDVTAVRSILGGIVGDLGVTAGEASSVSGCINYGILRIVIETDNEALYAGGIAGYLSGAVTLDQCVNYGDLSMDGGVYSTTNSQSGNVTTGDAASGYFGGLVGNTGIPAITNSANKGTVSGDMWIAGGLVGRANAALTLTNCYNTGAVTETGDYANQDRVRLGGLVGSSYFNRHNLTLNNCYSTGAVSVLNPTSSAAVGELHCNDVDNGAHGGGTATTTVNNSFGPGSLSSITAAQLGSAYKEDTQNANGGKPLLTWEDSEPNDETYAVTFSVTPAHAIVTVYTDAAMEQPVTKGADGYALPMGTYYYKITAQGYGTETGSFTVSIRPVTVTVALKQAVTVIFRVTPSDASFRLTDSSGVEIIPASSDGGVYSFSLYIGSVYTYTALKNGYNGVTREYTAAAGGTISVTLTESGQTGDNTPIAGGDSISAGGKYNLERKNADIQGTITINTTDPVTLIGTGTSLADVYKNLYINCAVEGVNLTIQYVYISNEVGTANLINFRGPGNRLFFEGVNILDQNTGAKGYAMLHVGENTELTLGGVSDSDTLYFYKSEQGAGIGGNGGAKGNEGQDQEYNGKITITGGNIFGKGSKQGALIGAGANANALTGRTPGEIVIMGGNLNLITNSRGGLIGGSAGTAHASPGSTVYIYGGTVTLNVDWSGAAIGGGGFAEDSGGTSIGGNDADGGTLYYYGGSIRTYIDYNAWLEGGWANAPYFVRTYGVNDTAITAKKVNRNAEAVYLLTLDTSKLSTSASYFTVLDGSTGIYNGGLHQYSYANESLYKTSQININYTIDNWRPLNDPNLYLYLTGADHTLTINGETVKAKWNSGTKTFTLTYATGSSSAPASATIEAKTETSGKISTATVDAAEMTKAISEAIANAAKDGTSPTLEIKVDAPDTSTTVKTVIPKSSFAEVANSTVTSLTITTPAGSVTLDAKALDSVAGQAKGTDVTISVAQVDHSTLTKDQQEAVGTGTVLDLSVTSGGAAIHDFGGGKATVTIPYTLKSGEKADGIVIWYLDDSGKLTQIEGAVYDTASGTVTFTTTHFSLYVVDFDLAAAWKNPFTDVAKTAWYYESVWYVVTNGLFKGTTDTTFSPEMPMTRGMFVTVLGRLDGIKDSDYTTSSFTDVGTGIYYSAGVEWAAKNNIVGGVGGGLFAPDKPITREEMAAILYRYAAYKKLDVTKADDLAAFSDAASVSDWAEAAFKWTVAEELINGINGTLSPKSTATRAQVATILMRFNEDMA